MNKNEISHMADWPYDKDPCIYAVRHLNYQERSLLKLHINHQETLLQCCSFGDN